MTTRSKTTSRTRQRTTKRRTRSITPEDLLKVVRVGDPRLSGDGRRVLFHVRSVGERNDQPTELWTAETGRDRVRRLTAGPRDRQGRFAADDSAVFFIRATEATEPQLAVVPLDGGEAEVLTDLPAGSIGGLEPSACGRWVAFTWRATDPERTPAAVEARKASGASEPPLAIEHPWYRLDGDGYFGNQRWSLRVLDLRDGSVRVLDDADQGGGHEFTFHPDGTTIAYTTNRSKRAYLEPEAQQVRLVEVATGRSRKVDWLPRGPKTGLRFSPDGSHLAYGGRVGTDDAYSTDNLELFVADLEQRTARSLSDHTDYCLQAYILGDCGESGFDAQIEWSADGRRVLARIGWHGEGRLVSFPIGRGPTRTLIEGHAENVFGNLDAKGRRICLVHGTATVLPEVHVAEVRARGPLELRRLTNFNGPLLKELTLSKPTSHWVTAPDGTKVQTWVMRPPGAKAGSRTPAMLQVHGGPHGLYGWAFFHEFQVLAARGWTVVYSNPRGSKGYGRDFCSAIRGSWGRDDWLDVQAVTTFMQAHKGIKRSRIGIMGGSYGGYMTNWAIGHSRDYRVAITDRCVSNLISMFGSSDFLWPPDRYWPGAPFDRPEELWEASPVKHLKGVKTPTLIIHSEGDLRCNIEQSEQVHAALAVQKVPCRFVRYPRSTSHGMSRSGPPDLRLHRLEEITDWLARYL